MAETSAIELKTFQRGRCLFQSKQTRSEQRVLLGALPYLFVFMALCVGLHSSPAGAACPSDWHDPHSSHRIPITVQNSSIAEQNFVVLVQLNSQNTGDYQDIQDDASGLRFFDDQGRELAYTRERWTTAGTSTLWVNLRELQTGSNSKFYLYSGNRATSDRSQPGRVYIHPNLVSVYHLNDRFDSDSAFGAPILDASPNHLDARGELNPVFGIETPRGYGVRMGYEVTEDQNPSGSPNSRICLNGHAAYAPAEKGGFGIWLLPSFEPWNPNAGVRGVLGMQRDERGNEDPSLPCRFTGLALVWWPRFGKLDFHYGRVGWNSSCGMLSDYFTQVSSDLVERDRWHQLASRWDDAAQLRTFFLDGQKIEDIHTASSQALLVNSNGSMNRWSFGSHFYCGTQYGDSQANEWEGLLDHTAFYDHNPSDAWIQTVYRSESNQLLAFGALERCDDPGNAAPVALADGPAKLRGGGHVELSGGRSYAASGGLTYFWQQTAGPAAVNLSDPNQSDLRFDAPFVTTASTMEFQLTVSDQSGRSDRTHVAFMVHPAPCNNPAAVDYFSGSAIDQTVWTIGSNSGNRTRIEDHELRLDAQGSEMGWVATRAAFSGINLSAQVRVTQPTRYGGIALVPSYTDNGNGSRGSGTPAAYRFYLWRDTQSWGPYQLIVEWKRGAATGSIDVTGARTIRDAEAGGRIATLLRIRTNAQNQIFFETSFDFGKNWSVAHSEAFDLPGFSLNDPFHVMLEAWNPAVYSALVVDDFAVCGATSSGPRPGDACNASGCPGALDNNLMCQDVPNDGCPSSGGECTAGNPQGLSCYQCGFDQCDPNLGSGGDPWTDRCYATGSQLQVEWCAGAADAGCTTPCASWFP